MAAIFRLQGNIDPGNPNSVTQADIAHWTKDGAVEWHAHTERIADALAEAHIVALPSYYGEGLPKTIVDAAAAGRPTVTTDLPGCRDAILPGVTGLLVRPRDPIDLADKLQQLIEDEPLRLRMGREARRLAHERFDIKKIVAIHMDIYERHLDLRKSTLRRV